MAKRIIRTVRWKRWKNGGGTWRTEGYEFFWSGKKSAIRTTRGICRALHASGHLVQLRVYNKNGRIAFENTYGKDPKRRKG